MSISRYRNDSPIRGNKSIATARAVAQIRLAVRRGDIVTQKLILKEGDRLDQIAAKFYGDGRYWWVIAAASNIGWWLQAPPGVVIRVPTDLSVVMRFV